MKILVCGSRSWSNLAVMRQTLCKAAEGHHSITIINGAARGADRMSSELAELFLWHSAEFPAQWDKYGKAAGPKRNQKMLEEAEPDLVLAFVDKPISKSRGTYDMVSRALAAGVTVIVTTLITQTYDSAHQNSLFDLGTL